MMAILRKVNLVDWPPIILAFEPHTDIKQDPPQLAEKKFIREGRANDPTPFLIWLGIFAILVGFIWGAQSWYYNWMHTQVATRPFLQVTNRQISLFLWQFPEHMRANVGQKNGYLPAFQYGEKIGLDPTLADHYVEAPPELLFLYHTWHRLLADVFFARSIIVKQFRQFLHDAAEWQPQFWQAAPQEYVKFVNSLSKHSAEEDMQKLSVEVLPKEVRQAFQGWKNFFKEGEEINALKVTYGDLEALLKIHPHYARNYWRNIFPKYLEQVSDMEVAQDQLAAFLKVAIYNMKEQEKEKIK
jgi:hypothetical protein